MDKQPCKLAWFLPDDTETLNQLSIVISPLKFLRFKESGMRLNKFTFIITEVRQKGHQDCPPGDWVLWILAGQFLFLLWASVSPILYVISGGLFHLAESQYLTCLWGRNNFKMRQLRLREGTWLTLGHTASWWWIPACLTPQGKEAGSWSLSSCALAAKLTDLGRGGQADKRVSRPCFPEGRQAGQG